MQIDTASFLTASPFRGFMMGGFESSTHRRHDGRQMDLIASSGHDRCAAIDYGLLVQHGIFTARDALRWHLVEDRPGHYDWSSWLPMVRAAGACGLQVVWDLCHYGLPADLDIFSDDFVARFAGFASAAARVLGAEAPEPRIWCPMNEISFWSWAGGDKGTIYPYAKGQADRLKRQLVRAAASATRAIRAVDPAARFVQPEPLIHIIGHPDRPEDWEPAEAYRRSQFQAWDMLAGRLAPELGGAEELLDLVGVNFYHNNQWVHEFETMSVGHRLFRPFEDMLAEVHARYERPLLIAETGAEGRNGPGWLRYVAGEVRAALAAGTPILGLCLYPAMDYPGWADDRHCPCGLIGASDDFSTRYIHRYMRDAIAEEGARTAQVGSRHGPADPAKEEASLVPGGLGRRTSAARARSGR